MREVPGLVESVLETFRVRKDGFPEYEVSFALESALKPAGTLTEEHRATWWLEMAAFRFVCILDDKSEWNTSYGPWAAITLKDGTRQLVPEIGDLDATVIDYWSQRASAESHPILKARYSDLVWDLSKTLTGSSARVDYAFMAVENYLKSTNLAKTPDDSQQAISWLRRALDIALRGRMQKYIPTIVQEFFQTYQRIMAPQLAGTWPFLFDTLYSRHGVTLDAPRIHTIISSLEEILAITSNLDDGERFNPWAAREASERLVRHYKKINAPDDVTRVIRKAELAFEEFAKRTSPLQAGAWLEETYHRYKDAGLKEDANRVMLALSEAARESQKNLTEFTVNVSIPANEIEGLFDDLCEGELDRVLTRIAIYFCPSTDEARASLDELRKKFKILAFSGEKIYQDGKYVAKLGSVDEDPEGRIIRQMSSNVDIMTPLLHEALQRIQATNGLNAESLCSFLYKSPLFDSDRRSVVEEGLKDYFAGRHVQSICVLVPQIEDTLRRMLAYFGEPTTKPGSPKTGGAMVEKSLNEILDNEVLGRELADDARLYFSSFLADRRSHNVRNRVAHGLLSAENFSWPIADRLIHILVLLAILVEI